MHACSQQTQTLNPELKPDAFSFQKTRQVFKPCCQNERMQAVTPLLQVRQLVDTMLLSTATIYFFFFSKKGKRKEEKLNWIAAYVPTTKFGKSGDCYQTLAFAQQQQLLLLMLPVHLHLLPTFNYYSPARRQRLPKAAAGLGWASLLLTSHSHLGGGGPRASHSPQSERERACALFAFRPLTDVENQNPIPIPPRPAGRVPIPTRRINRVFSQGLPRKSSSSSRRVASHIPSPVEAARI
jgi:hypothetical protein